MNMEDDDAHARISLALQECLQQSLSIFLARIDKRANAKKISPLRVISIALSRFIYRELLLLSESEGIELKKLNELFIALLSDLIEQNPEGKLINNDGAFNEKKKLD